MKDQLTCGSCWAFSTTGNIEGQWFLAGHSLVSLSEQNILDCDTTDEGCNGGLMSTAIMFVKKEGGIDTEASYPYNPTEASVTCKYTTKHKAASVTGLASIESDETQMATWVAAKGPLSVAVDATSWQTYTGGILTNAVSDSVDHGVLVTGYGVENGVKYWTIKNSWGLDWGEEGYIRIKRDANTCLINTMPTSATVAKAETGGRVFDWN